MTLSSRQPLLTIHRDRVTRQPRVCDPSVQTSVPISSFLLFRTMIPGQQSDRSRQPLGPGQSQANVTHLPQLYAPEAGGRRRMRSNAGGLNEQHSGQLMANRSDAFTVPVSLPSSQAIARSTAPLSLNERPFIASTFSSQAPSTTSSSPTETLSDGGHCLPSPLDLPHTYRLHRMEDVQTSVDVVGDSLAAGSGVSATARGAGLTGAMKDEEISLIDLFEALDPSSPRGPPATNIVYSVQPRGLDAGSVSVSTITNAGKPLIAHLGCASFSSLTRTHPTPLLRMPFKSDRRRTSLSPAPPMANLSERSPQLVLYRSQEILLQLIIIRSSPTVTAMSPVAPGRLSPLCQRIPAHCLLPAARMVTTLPSLLLTRPCTSIQTRSTSFSVKLSLLDVLASGRWLFCL
jgi:hypothetical protein